MAPLTSRNGLLKPGLSRLVRSASQFGAGQAGAVESAGAAVRRLLAIVPWLKLDRATARKLSQRLRKLRRRIKKVRDVEAVVRLIDDLHESDRLFRPAITHVRDQIRRSREVGQVAALRRKVGTDIRAAVRKLGALAEDLNSPKSKARWNEGAVVEVLSRKTARHAAALKRAINEAGAVYMTDRLRAPGRAVRKLRRDASVLLDITKQVPPSDVRLLSRTQDLFVRLRDLQRLIDRVRQSQSSLAPLDLKAWHDLDAFIIALEKRCRRLHARYVSDRTALIAVCDRLGAKVTDVAGVKQNVS